MNLGDTIISYIRTLVPLAVGWLVTALHLVNFDSDAAIAAGVAIVTAAYYLLARTLEKRWAWFGWFLGAPRIPTYAKR